MATTRATPTRKTPAVFDIAAAEKEIIDGGRPVPFDINLPDGSRVTFIDPAMLDWQIAATLTEATPLHFLRSVLSPEDFPVFQQARFSNGALRKLMQAYNDHYNLDELDSGN